MKAFQYSRLSSNDPDTKPYKFSALDGPSYYTYGVPAGKYSSAFTYTQQKAVDGYSSTDMHCGSPEMYSTCNTTKPPSQTLTFRVLTFVVSCLCYLLFVLTLPFSAIFVLKSAQIFERFVVFRLGRLLTTRGPGYVIIFPCIDQWIKVDLRTKAFSVPPLKAITADGATIEIGADVYFRVKDPVLSVSNVQDLNHATRILCQTLLQKHIGKQNLCEAESDRAGITDALLTDVNVMAQTWGVEVGKIELSAIKVHSQPNPLFNQATNDVLSCLSSVLFPTGVNNAPIEQLQQFYRMTSNSSEKLSVARGAQRSVIADVGKSLGESGPAVNPMSNLIALVQPHLGMPIVHEFGCSYKFVIANEDGMFETYHLDLKNGGGRAGMGDMPDGSEADVTLHLSSSLIPELLAQNVRPFDAYMDGRLTVAGDLRSAMRLGELIKLITTGTIPVIQQ